MHGLETGRAQIRYSPYKICCVDHVIIVNRIWAEPRVTAVQDPSQGQGLAEGTVSESVKAKVLPFSRKCKVSADICLGDLG